VLHREGLSEDGGPLICFDAVLQCNYQDTTKTVLTAEKKLVQLNGIALFPGDIAPEVDNISGGTANVYGVQRTIFTGTKARNPDSTVNYCELRLI